MLAVQFLAGVACSNSLTCKTLRRELYCAMPARESKVALAPGALQAFAGESIELHLEAFGGACLVPFKSSVETHVPCPMGWRRGLGHGCRASARR